MFKIHFNAFLELFMKNIFLHIPKYSAKNQAALPIKTAKNQATPPAKTAKILATPLGILLPLSGDYCTVPNFVSFRFYHLNIIPQTGNWWCLQ